MYGYDYILATLREMQYKPIILFCGVMQKKRFILSISNFSYSSLYDIQQSLYNEEAAQQILIFLYVHVSFLALNKT